MYSVSAAYRAAMEEAFQRHRVKGKIGNINFDGADILKDTLEVSNQCSDSKDLSLGGVFVGKLKLTLLNDFGITRGTWLGREIELTFEQQLDEENDIWEAVPVGVFEISEANHTERGIELVCYDHMSKLDKAYPALATNGTIYDIMSLICARCGVLFGLTQKQCEALPNGKVVFGLYPDNGCKTWRDVVHYVAQLVGGFATADRHGAIVLKNFGSLSGYNVDTRHRLTGSKFSDYKTNYTGLSVVNMTEKSTRYINVSPDNGLTLNLGSNPFLQYGTEATIKEILTTIIETANTIKYTPFNSAMVGNPALDLGDIIIYTDGTAGTRSMCCIMSYTWKFNRMYSVNGFGKNPSLATAQSKAEKDISGLSGQSKADTLQFFTYENAKEINVGSSETLICDLRATNTKATFVDFWIEAKMKITLSSSAAVLYFRYAEDAIEEIYKPVMTYNHNGTYTFNLNYYWRLETVLQHSFKVYLRVVGGTAEIEPASIHALLKGQGMTESKSWDGLIEVSDGFSSKLEGGISVRFNDGGANFTFEEPPTTNISDVFHLDLNGDFNITFIDEMTMLLREREFYVTSEDGILLTSEDGTAYIKN